MLGIWYRLIGLVARVFVHDPGDQGSILGRHIQDTKNCI